MLMYQRSQLALLERWGGALFRPMFAEFPDSYDGFGYSGELLMWGSDVMVELNADNRTGERNFTFPKELDWVSLTTFKTFKGGQTI
jgi:alpha-glucosidase (family GH31 glycosyl hydrolase)